MSEKNVTIRDLAVAAGVSIGTVSRALKNQSGLSSQTRSDVMRVAQDLGYDVSKLRTGKPRRVLFLFNRTHGSLSANPFYSMVLQGVEQACREEHVSLGLLSVGSGDPVLPWLRRQGSDALLAVGFFDSDLLAQMQATDLPMVAIDHFSSACFCVNGDSLEGSWLATRHLIEQGCQRVAMISGPVAQHSVGLRARGFRKALFEAGRLADPDLEVTIDANLPYAEAAMAAMQKLLALPVRPDGVFAYNDETALNAMQACRQAGLNIPKDIAFAGYDDIAAASRSQPPLTTVHVDAEALGQQAIQHLLLGEAAPGEQMLPVQLRVRESSLHR